MISSRIIQPIYKRFSWQRLNLAQQFLLGSLGILVASMVGVGWWVGKQIEIGVINRTAGDAALYVDSFIDPPLQGLGKSGSLTPKNLEALNQLVINTPLGQHLVAFKIWDTHGKIVYSTNPAQIGQVYPIKEELRLAYQGEVTSDISNLQDTENLLERGKWKQLQEIYSPVTENSTSHVIGVVEFYQPVEALYAETRRAQLSSWGLVAAAGLILYGLLSIFVRQASNTILHQQTKLNDQVTRLTELLAQNEELSDRVRRAANRATTLNERYLRRISAELHDGPAQELGYSLLRMDGSVALAEKCPLLHTNGKPCWTEMKEIETSIQRAIQEIRHISSGLGLPELDHLSLPATLTQAVHAHERRTGTKVDLSYQDLPENASLPAKITLFRLIQEALNNSYRHAGGASQRVYAQGNGSDLKVEISDQGAGFDYSHKVDQDIHLGLSGMRERVESLGGIFIIQSKPEQGTRISARIPFSIPENSYE